VSSRCRRELGEKAADHARRRPADLGALANGRRQMVFSLVPP